MFTTVPISIPVMTLPLYLVAAFTDDPFAGNPAAVVLLDEVRDDEWMAGIARAMNQSETAFILPRGDDFELRWFTPEREIALCGHATLASAHVLFERGLGRHALFHTKSGILSCAREGDSIEMDFPSDPLTPIDPPAEVEDALGATIEGCWRGNIGIVAELDDAAAVRAVDPDLRAFLDLEDQGVLVTAASDDPAYDFISRYFVPAAGIPEDPVTGAAHCALAPMWASRLGKLEMVAYQASSRGGVVRVRVVDDRVRLIGRAVTVSAGELLI